MNNERRSHWENVHARRSDDSVSWFQQIPETSLRLLTEGLPQDAAIIDVGAGASRLVDALLAEGRNDLTVLDISEAALARTRSRLGTASGQVEWVTGDITQWKPERVYDAWHDRAVFHFMVEPADREGYKTALRRGVRVGGRIVIATFAEDGPEMCSDLPVRRYSPESLLDELGNGFQLISEHHEIHRTPAGRDQSFQFVVLERSAQA